MKKTFRGVHHPLQMEKKLQMGRTPSDINQPTYTNQKQADCNFVSPPVFCVFLGSQSPPALFASFCSDDIIMCDGKLEPASKIFFLL